MPAWWDDSCAAGWERIGLLGGTEVGDICAAGWRRWTTAALIGGQRLRCYWAEESAALLGRKEDTGQLHDR